MLTEMPASSHVVNTAQIHVGFVTKIALGLKAKGNSAGSSSLSTATLHRPNPCDSLSEPTAS